MPMMCAVTFSPRGRLYYADPGPYSPKVGDKVLIPTDAGPEVAECMWAPQWFSDDVGGLPVLVGMAKTTDIERHAVSRRRRAQARVAAKRLIREHGLPMKVVGVDHISTENMFTIYFTADHRVDFRGLVSDLARTLTARIDLRQLSARDSARIQGGIGSCGRDLCCATFLTDFEPVSIRMAKDQDLPLNPMKISGACGRLMCCLRYEHPLYEQFKADVPAVGARVSTPDGDGRVVSHDVPRDQVVVKLDAGGGRCACSRASVCGSRKEYEAARPAAAATVGEAGSPGWPGTAEGPDGDKGTPGLAHHMVPSPAAPPLVAQAPATSSPATATPTTSTPAAPAQDNARTRRRLRRQASRNTESGDAESGVQAPETSPPG
ncbi:PSP1 domain-containing protein [Protofrankia symbiont of Coriaria ruscifolia]|uniref:PSP1 domain-containing protein n=1 Tax=Protofrankia symbiont of Coriaria ruscifolia TaxID=1306542 RepID=UPI00104185AB|nr:regulatory iron-sulfur-containing complex subunit RicT [Protofrankia symbiont of Coriaria ruscifolia]